MATIQPATTVRLKLVLAETNASGQVTRINDNQALLDLLSGTIWIKDKDLSSPPALVNGNGYIVGASPTGAWAGHANDLAFVINSAWVFVTPWKGLTVYVEDEDKDYKFTTSWAIKVASTSVAPINTWVTKTATFTPASNEAAIYKMNAAGGAFNATLPAASANAGVTWTFKRTDSSGNAVSIVPNGSDLIEGVNASIPLLPGQALTLSSNGTEWYLV